MFIEAMLRQRFCFSVFSCFCEYLYTAAYYKIAVPPLISYVFFPSSYLHSSCLLTYILTHILTRLLTHLSLLSSPSFPPVFLSHLSLSLFPTSYFHAVEFYTLAYAFIPLSPPFPADAFVTIPMHLISRDSLIYVGLSSSKADELWDKWTNWPSTGPQRETDPDDGCGLVVTFLDFLVGHSVGNTADAVTEEDDEWRSCLDKCGIDKRRRMILWVLIYGI